jgi:hypothetical protein
MCIPDGKDPPSLNIDVQFSHLKFVVPGILEDILREYWGRSFGVGRRLYDVTRKGGRVWSLP